MGGELGGQQAAAAKAANGHVLQYNEIGVAGLEAIIAAVAENTVLTRLDLAVSDGRQGGHAMHRRRRRRR